MTAPAAPGSALIGRPGRSRLVAGLAVLASGVHLWGLYRVSGPPVGGLPNFDKLQHIVGFALPVMLLTLTFGLRRLERGLPPRQRTLALVVAAFAAHAVISELVQHFCYTQRTGDPLDVLADGVGVAIGALAAVLLLRTSAR